jgi:hypothetical protein
VQELVVDELRDELRDECMTVVLHLFRVTPLASRHVVGDCVNAITNNDEEIQSRSFYVFANCPINGP